MPAKAREMGIYEKVIALCNVREWEAQLAVQSGGKVLELRVVDGDDVIAIAKSRLPVPECFEALGEKAMSDLKGGLKI